MQNTRWTPKTPLMCHTFQLSSGLRSHNTMVERTKNFVHFPICACHPCAGAMLIFSVSFQFYRMIPEGNPMSMSSHPISGVDLGLAQTTQSVTLALHKARCCTPCGVTALHTANNTHDPPSWFFVFAALVLLLLLLLLMMAFTLAVWSVGMGVFV